jgi:hypothetical protein
MSNNLKRKLIRKSKRHERQEWKKQATREILWEVQKEDCQKEETGG